KHRACPMCPDSEVGLSCGEIPLPDGLHLRQGFERRSDCVEARGIRREPLAFWPPAAHGGDVKIERRKALAQEPWLAGLAFENAPEPAGIGVHIFPKTFLCLLARHKTARVVGVGEGRVDVRNDEHEPAQEGWP